MSSLRKDLRNELERTVIKARDIAEAAATAALQALAVDQPKPFPHMDADARALRNRLRERGRAAGDVRDAFSNTQPLGHLAQLVGYEHWHRMLFARFLAENGLLLEPEHQVALSLADVEELAREEGADLWQLAGSYAQRMLPEVFRNDDPALEVTLAREDRVKLEKLLADFDPATFTATDSLGWTYQFWQTKRKGEVNASGVKIGADEISPVTQLFTEDYMVDFLLDNTLGAWWAARERGRLARNIATEEDARAAVALPGCEWKYLRFIKQEGSAGVSPASQHGESGQDARAPLWTPAAGTFDGWPKTVAELKCLDPCMGSGHFVVAMFERLVALRIAEENLSEIDAVRAVIRDNLFGLELDPRCTQIAAFNLALAAWRRVGHCTLPPMHLACSGLAPNASEQEWIDLAGDNPRLKFGMQALHRLFAQAPVLGSLINPKSATGVGYSFEFEELQPLMDKAMAGENIDDATHEVAVTAKGIAKAAEILARDFTLVATNVPFLGRAKQCEILMDYCERNHRDAQRELATCFVERCLEFCAVGSTVSLVTPQNWLFLKAYSNLRERLLNSSEWNVVARLGPKGFQTPMWDFNIQLGIITSSEPRKQHDISGLDVSLASTPEEKSTHLQGGNNGAIFCVGQEQQLNNPGKKISLEIVQSDKLLSKYATAYQGLASGDLPSFGRCFWELSVITEDWRFFQSTVEETACFKGLEQVIFLEDGKGRMKLVSQNPFRGVLAWGKPGVAVSQMAALPVSLYLREPFDNNMSVISPIDSDHAVAIWAYCSDKEYRNEVRRIDQSLKVTNASLTQVPFDLAHWQKVAAEKYPDGLPAPHSDNPTQWLFNGHPAGSDQPLHVAVARLLGYRWPRQTGSEFPDCPALGPDGLEFFCDDDGIVCLTPLRGEAKAADRLRKLLDAAYGSAGVPPASQHDASGQDARAPLKSGQDGHAPWNERQLLSASGAKSTTLEDWLRDEFFEQHAKLFHHRPFIWHIWDGRPDGFHALVNYHQLAAPDGAGHKLLETLTFAYLGDWIRRQKDDAANKVPGAESRLEAAEALQQELKNILQGDPPYDLFIRWKPLHQQAIGWHPDLNDGVRLNIRPFLYAKDVKKKDAGILRWKPNVKWTKDRGTEPQRPKTDFPWFWTWDEKTPDFPGTHKFDGNRWNDLHYSNETKQAARAAHEKKGTEA